MGRGNNKVTIKRPFDYNCNQMVKNCSVLMLEMCILKGFSDRTVTFLLPKYYDSLKVWESDRLYRFAKTAFGFGDFSKIRIKRHGEITDNHRPRRSSSDAAL